MDFIECAVLDIVVVLRPRGLCTYLKEPNFDEYVEQQL